MAGDQRRLAAIVVADVAGYSRLMGADESGTLTALKSVRIEVVDPKIAEHSGRLVKTMGDGLLMEFSSTVNAVRCAVEIQRAMSRRNADVPTAREFRFRFGINVGDIIVEGDDIFGDGVNVAARLEALAEPGGICVSRPVRDQVHGRLDVAFETLGMQRIKNIAEPVEVFRVRVDSKGGGRFAAARIAAARMVTAPSRQRTAGLFVMAVVAVWTLPQFFAPALQPTAPALSVAITALSADDVEAQRFADSLGRHLKNRLPDARFAGRLRIMAAAASPDSRTIDRRHGIAVRYLIEGDIGHHSGRVDVHLRLLDAASGDQIWTTRHILQASDLSTDFSSRLATLMNGVRSAVLNAETRRVVAMPLSALSAPEFVVRAAEMYNREPSLAGIIAAHKLVDEALRLDPNYAPAWNAKAVLVNFEGDLDPNQDRDRIGREQDRYTERAVALDRSNAGAWDMRATALAYLARWDGALEASLKAMEIEPHDLEHRLNNAWIKGLMGRPDEALAVVDEVLRIDRENLAGSAMRVACEAHVLAGHASAAVSACEKSIALGYNWIVTVYLIAAYANNGDVAKAAAAKADLLRTVPGYTIAQLRAKRYSDHPDYLILAEKNWYSGLRKAGIEAQ